MVKVHELKFLGLRLDRGTVALWLRRFCRILLWAAVAWVGVAALLGYAVYYHPRQTLTMDSGAVNADVLVLLGGGPEGRPQRAAQLFKLGEAPKILVSGSGDCEENVQKLQKNGVPKDVISQECNSISTYENAKLCIPLLRQMGAHRVIIVTSWYHSRRALSCFEHFAPDMQFYSRPSYFGYQPTIWNRRLMNDYVRSEYIKLLFYWVWHGVCPFYLTQGVSGPFFSAVRYQRSTKAVAQR